MLLLLSIHQKKIRYLTSVQPKINRDPTSINMFDSGPNSEAALTDINYLYIYFKNKLLLKYINGTQPCNT